MDSDGDWDWLRRTGQKRYVDMHLGLGCLAFPVVLGFLILGVHKDPLWCLGALSAGLAFYVHHRWRLHLHATRIFCPRCGFNPTRRKSDGAVRADFLKVRRQLQRYEACPACAHDGREHVPDRIR